MDMEAGFGLAHSHSCQTNTKRPLPYLCIGLSIAFTFYPSIFFAPLSLNSSSSLGYG